jgi:hypothetical protein
MSISRYLQTLEFKSEPNYNRIQDEIAKAASNYNLMLDRNFDWSEKAAFTKSGDSKNELKMEGAISQSKDLSIIEK